MCYAVGMMTLRAGTGRSLKAVKQPEQYQALPSLAAFPQSGLDQQPSSTYTEKMDHMWTTPIGYDGVGVH